ncbi:MAG: VWA domain-containing protein [Bdellovibrionaceae bacterium]|nr:VWA domain-containing protein [Bdellovibrio sp.]
MLGLAFKWGDLPALYWLFSIVALIAAYFFFEKVSIKKLNKAFGAKVAAYLTQSVSYKKRRLQIFIQALGIFFIVVALARPQAGESQQEVKSEGVELLILADVSESMMAEDVKPSRLAQMKVELSKLLDLMPGNKVGIIAFAGSSSLLCPLTSDPNALRMYIDSLDINSVSTQGTNIETALAQAKEAFERGGVTQDQHSRTTRAILVVSDGEDQEKGALETAKKLAKDNIRIYTMAYGTEKGAAIPSRDQFGSMTGFKKDSSGQTILTQVKGDFLSQLASVGEGKFYFAYFNGDHLKKFTQDLGQLERTQFQTSMMTQFDEKFTVPLLIGTLLLMLSLLLNDVKKVISEWKGRHEAS